MKQQAASRKQEALSSQRASIEPQAKECWHQQNDYRPPLVMLLLPSSLFIFSDPRFEQPLHFVILQLCDRVYKGNDKNMSTMTHIHHQGMEKKALLK
jgi:hypothetical protein